jgi:AcrR family transcriptional regulator
MGASVTKSTRLTGPQRREQILDATRALAAERGFHAVSIDAVAKRAGITRPVVYDHFADLPGLLQALLEREGARAVDQLMPLLPRPAQGVGPRDLLVGALRGFLEAVRAEPVTWRLVLMPPEGAPALLRERVSQVRAEVTGRLAEVAPRALTGGRAERPPDPELTAITLQAISEEAARLMLERPDEFPIERLVAHAEWMLGLLGVPGSD